LFDQGTNAQAAGNLDKAAACFEKILNAHPNHIGALYHLGNLHRKNNRLDQAIDLHARAAAQAPDNIQVLFSLAEDYDASGQHRQKIEILKKAQRLNPGSMVPLFKLRDAYVQTGDWAQACAAQKQVLPLLRDKALKQKEQLRYSQLIYAKGMDHIKNGNPESAITEFRRALRENSRCLPAYIALGDLYRDSGHLKNALKTWKAGFQHTQSPVCLLRMQNRGDPGGDRKDLIKLYKGALEEAQNSDKALLSLLLGNLYLETGHPDEAIETLESVPAAHSMMHDILLANAYQEKHNPDQSQEVSQAVFSKA
ncbi:MAG: tetratricopeptide repeat protein, partial [Nitrospinaceae bacterium]|nr:tetratricopeptide repeat protein [Nitrospinaceae bacterium]NIR54695.1 tetratricopeptide repeat protein [Nitrospinaceae bacterium]NIS85116.1 tetratricopeptide repeat protein [Nitrospinaceae bacterium]NIT81933.1 tetratricopeptide repeat protein [Nitrospinaceae bacterium]NIU44194.1 tetratricopeptide repeat protein [Nitrospinaceae bacterium]